MNSTLPTMYELCLMHAKADRTMRSVVSEQLAQQHLSLMEWLALCTVSNGQQSGISMSKIARTLDVTLPQVTALISSLVKLGLAKQKVLESDRRGRQVMLTIQGKRALQKLENQVATAIRSWSEDIPREKLYTYMETVSLFAGKTKT